MKRLVFLLALPYVVTVTDFGWECVNFPKNNQTLSLCLEWKYFKKYHLNGFKDCIAWDNKCDYMYDIAAGLNMQYEKRVKDHPCHDLTVDQCEDIMTDRLEIQKLKDSK